MNFSLPKILPWISQQVEDCKKIDEVNSRICFLLTSVTISLCMLILTIGVFRSDRVKEVYEGGIAVLAGGHLGAAYGRSKTKGPNGSSDSGGNGTS
jgi:hypothetical protein